MSEWTMYTKSGLWDECERKSGNTFSQGDGYFYRVKRANDSDTKISLTFLTFNRLKIAYDRWKEGKCEDHEFWVGG